MNITELNKRIINRVNDDFIINIYGNDNKQEIISFIQKLGFTRFEFDMYETTLRFGDRI